MEPTGTNGRTRHTPSDPLLGDWVSSCGGFLVGWQGTLFLVVTTIGKAFDLLASVVRFPDRHDRNRGWFRCRPPVFPVGRSEWFCGGHGPGETPGPFPNPEAKAWHGDGTALERVWESSAPPHLNFLNPELSAAPRDFSLCDSYKSNYVRKRTWRSLIAALRQRKPPTEQCRRFWRCCYERAFMGTVLSKTHYHRWRSSMGLALTTV